MIQGVETKKLKVVTDDRGYLMEMLRCDDNLFKKFGQVYLSVCNPDIVKGLIDCIIEVYSDRKPSDILMHDAYFITEMGFHSHLSMTRSKGLTSMLHHVYHTADIAEQCLKS